MSTSPGDPSELDEARRMERNKCANKTVSEVIGFGGGRPPWENEEREEDVLGDGGGGRLDLERCMRCLL